MVWKGDGESKERPTAASYQCRAWAWEAAIWEGLMLNCNHGCWHTLLAKQQGRFFFLRHKFVDVGSFVIALSLEWVQTSKGGKIMLPIFILPIIFLLTIITRDRTNISFTFFLFFLALFSDSFKWKHLTTFGPDLYRLWGHMTYETTLSYYMLKRVVV